MRAAVVVVIAALASCSAPPAGDPITFDPCGRVTVTARGATAEQLAAIDDAIASWRAVGVDGVARTDGAGDVTVDFATAAPALHGLYDAPTATIYVNVDLDDPAQRAITIAHELGHAFGLVHVAPDVRPDLMNPGNLTLPPDDADRSALDALWGACR